MRSRTLTLDGARRGCVGSYKWTRASESGPFVQASATTCFVESSTAEVPICAFLVSAGRCPNPATFRQTFLATDKPRAVEFMDGRGSAVPK